MTLTYQVEAFSAVLAEMQPLWHAHWQEVAMNQDTIPLNPDLDAYRALEAAGVLHVLTVRDQGRVVGYHVAVIRPHLHYQQSLSAMTDLYYLHPDYRKGRAGVRLFQAFEASCKALGVEKLFTGTKLHLDLGRLFERLGWVETERLYTKYLGDTKDGCSGSGRRGRRDRGEQRDQ